MDQKIQHWIPQSYLKAWVDPETPPNYEGYVWVFPRDGKNGKKKSPKKIFHKIDMYTFHHEGERNLSLERLLSKIEGGFIRVKNNTLTPRKKLNTTDRSKLLTFMAAMRGRTLRQETHLRDQWRDVHTQMELMRQQVLAMPEESRRQLASIHTSHSSFSSAQVAKLAETPMQLTLPTFLKVLPELFDRMHLSVFCSNSNAFITSDSPCVWFDPDSSNYPPMFRAPALGSPTIEVTLPISPTQLLFLSHNSLDEYLDIPPLLVDEINRRTRFHADSVFVNNANVVNDYWFTNKKPT